MSQPPDLSELVGCTVSRLCFNSQLTLSIASTDGVYGERVDALLVVESPFTVSRAGESQVVVPGENQGLEATLDLLHSTITSVVVGADESLSITLDSQQEVHIPRDPHYEAWQISGRGVEGWIAGPM